VLPPLLGDLQHRLPQTELRLTVGDSAELLIALLNNDVELAFWLREEPHPQLEQTVLTSEPLVWVLPPDEPLATATSLPANAFMDRRLILRGMNSAARRVVQALLERENAVPVTVLEIDNLEAIKRSVEVGFGVSIAPRSAVQRETDSGSLCSVRLAAADAQVTSSWARYAGRRLSAPARVFVDVLETLRPSS
jgi:DNA-binding transcriptional LysR family regulator